MVRIIYVSCQVRYFSSVRKCIPSYFVLYIYNFSFTMRFKYGIFPCIFNCYILIYLSYINIRDGLSLRFNEFAFQWLFIWPIDTFSKKWRQTSKSIIYWWIVHRCNIPRGLRVLVVFWFFFLKHNYTLINHFIFHN